jgi:hypothetical protein
MEDFMLQEYDEWLTDHMEELVARYPFKVVAVRAGRVISTGDSEAEIYQWVRKTGLVPMPLVFRVPRKEDLDVLPKSGWNGSWQRSGVRKAGGGESEDVEIRNVMSALCGSGEKAIGAMERTLSQASEEPQHMPEQGDQTRWRR